MHYWRLVIFVLSTGLHKSATSTYFFGKLFFRLSVFSACSVFWIRCYFCRLYHLYNRWEIICIFTVYIGKRCYVILFHFIKTISAKTISCLTCSHASRALVLHVFRAVCALVPHVSYALRTLVPHVPCALLAYVPHVLRDLRALKPHMFRASRALVFHVPRASFALCCTCCRTSCAQVPRPSSLASFMCRYYLFCTCFPMLHVTFFYLFSFISNSLVLFGKSTTA